MSIEFPPSPGPVEQLFEDYHTIQDSLPQEAVTDRVALDTHFRKLFVMAAASHLEALMTFHMREYFSTLGESAYEFVRRYSLDRKFFQWFDFDSDMPAKLFKSFGKRCQDEYQVRLSSSDQFERSARSFMLICSTRNNMVHGNLAEFSSELTPEEIEKHFRSGVTFPDLAIRIIRTVSLQA